jgi:hypothetical protein
MGEEERSRIAAMLLRYTAPAFGHKDATTMSELEQLDHVDHSMGGPGTVTVFLVCGMYCQSNDESAKTVLRLFAHANFCHVVCNDSTCIYLNGVCCDPNQQGGGIATTLIIEAVKVLRQCDNPKYLALRTMNVAVVKILHRLANSVTIYPVDEAARPDISQVGRALGELLEWTNLIPDQLIIPKAYPPFLIPFFKGTPSGRTDDSVATRVATLIDRDQGDALVCIVDLSDLVA